MVWQGLQRCSNPEVHGLGRHGSTADCTDHIGRVVPATGEISGSEVFVSSLILWGGGEALGVLATRPADRVGERAHGGGVYFPGAGPGVDGEEIGDW